MSRSPRPTKPSPSEIRDRFNAVSDQLGLSLDERSEVLLFYPVTYIAWLETGYGLEIKGVRLVDITHTLEIVSRAIDKRHAREWLTTPNLDLNQRIPIKILRVGKVHDVGIAATALNGVE